ncbi:hypothetical protein VB715_03985 [Crocosphaera sp. UHCC 0190]|uniref:hypothetical protein n=1 Tax=Crocosphaera sp. UHCC 0190 TaxID=3110246 RepID=UPI002B1FD7B5|nr:hypothetical protein [Crocosphaera sp. UHCC 0190]MEA5508916.1 hypothetical protein [Crocosphaera sp. UHCC 0190]
MKLQEIKQKVYQLTCTKNTKILKKQRPELVKNRDLRYKIQWIAILDEVKLLRSQGLDFSLTDLEESEKMLKKSLLTVGHLAGLSNEMIELDWQRIKLENQFTDIHDIHIEEL